jgi:hypothetical protein
MDDPSNDLFLREFYRNQPKKRDYMCLCCGTFIAGMTIGNALLIGSLLYTYSDHYQEDIDEIHRITEGTFLHNETAIKDILHKIPTLVNHFCESYGC